MCLGCIVSRESLGPCGRRLNSVFISHVYMTSCRPFTNNEKDDLQFLYDEWAHPFFISKEQFVKHMDGTGQLQGSACEDWCEQTLPSWRHSIWVGVESPWKVISKFNPFIWWKVVREIVTLERMHQAFASGLMQYGATDCDLVSVFRFLSTSLKC